MLIWSPGCLIINRSCLKLQRSAVNSDFGEWASGLITSALAGAAAASSAQSFTSRELVDVEFGDSNALNVLISSPGAHAPGLYRWAPGVPAPTRVCALASPAGFSFDRRYVIERARGEPAIVNVFDARRCRRLAHLRIPGAVVVDADARDRQLAIATRDKDGNRKVRLYNFRGKPVAETAVGVNVEMGFAPDGKALVNFDLADKTESRSGIWTLPRLTRAQLPTWAREGEMTFVQGARYVKRYTGNLLSVVRWPDGRHLHTVTASQNARLRALSDNGRFGLLHQRQAQIESLDWIDFASGRRLTIASGQHGSIDHATIDATGHMLAWSVRSTDGDNRVTVHRASIDRSGETAVIRLPDPARAATDKPAPQVGPP